ncbi:hypothetical protein WJX84_007758 [Apatococcus fuscideae]|uniref:GLTSCR protein conserved domain-containing protein n=1 Tax=Apatococcus fuscideae TaxID=2026836 RepID=A0AAW1T461_9CHLO
MFADDAAFEDCWKICNLDYNLPFSSLEDVVGRLLPFHVLAAQEEEDVQTGGTPGGSSGVSSSQQAQTEAELAQLLALRSKIEGIQAGLGTSRATAEDAHQLEKLLHQDAQQRLMVQRTETKQVMADALSQSNHTRANALDNIYPSSQPICAASLAQQQAWAQYHIGPQLQQEQRPQQPVQQTGGWSGWQPQAPLQPNPT